MHIFHVGKMTYIKYAQCRPNPTVRSKHSQKHVRYTAQVRHSDIKQTHCLRVPHP